MQTGRSHEACRRSLSALSPPRVAAVCNRLGEREAGFVSPDERARSGNAQRIRLERDEVIVRRTGSVLTGTFLSQRVPSVLRMRSDWESSVEASVVPRLRRARWIGSRRRISYPGHAADSAAGQQRRDRRVRLRAVCSIHCSFGFGGCRPASLAVSPDESQTTRCVSPIFSLPLIEQLTSFETAR